jgi:hypothetical protein
LLFVVFDFEVNHLLIQATSMHLDGVSILRGARLEVPATAPRFCPYLLRFVFEIQSLFRPERGSLNEFLLGFSFQ